MGNGTNGKVSLSNFAELKKGLGPVSIKRENQRRIVHITASILTSDNANLVEDAIKEGIANTFIIPDNVSVSYEGSWKDTNDQMKLYSGILITPCTGSFLSSVAIVIPLAWRRISSSV